MLIDVIQKKSAGENEFHIFFNGAPKYIGTFPWASVNVNGFELNNTMPLKLKTPNGEEVFHTRYELLQNVKENLARAKWLFGQESKSNILTVLDNVGTTHGEFYESQQGWADKKFAFSYFNDVFFGFFKATGKQENISIYNASDVQVAQIVNNIAVVKDNLSEYKIYLKDEHSYLAELLSLFVLYFDARNHSNAGQVFKGVKANFSVSYDRNDPKYNENWIAENFGTPQNATPQNTYNQPRNNYTQPNSNYSQPNSNYSQPNSNYSQPNNYAQQNIPQPNNNYAQQNIPQPNNNYTQPNTPYPNQAYQMPPYVPPKKRRKVWPIVLIVGGSIFALIIILVIVMLVFMNSRSTMTEVTFGGDSIITLYGATGVEKSVSGYSTSTGFDGSTIEISYGESMSDSLVQEYIDYLIEEDGFVCTEDDGYGNIELSKESVDSGKIIQAKIYFQFGYLTVTYAKGEGTITYYDTNTIEITTPVQPIALYSPPSEIRKSA